MEIERAAQLLGEFVSKRVRGKRLNDPQVEVRSIVADFYVKNPIFIKYHQKLDVECLASPYLDGVGYGVTDIKVLILG
jgi:hypothetical protein